MEGHDTTCSFCDENGLSFSSSEMGEWGEVKSGKTRKETAALTRRESDAYWVDMAEEVKIWLKFEGRIVESC